MYCEEKDSMGDNQATRDFKQRELKEVEDWKALKKYMTKRERELHVTWQHQQMSG